ncbi:MAG TPA: trypsin-like peptidase domain-containing protein, partial [Blastocatellia bacterium]|nr:trypsin-like peptidase domain-containing protein [Blastocatellia bacterium]
MANLVIARRSPWIWLALISLGTLLLGWFAGSVLTANGWSPFRDRQMPLAMTSDQRRDQVVNLNTGFSAIARNVTPAVVTIETSSRARPQPFPFPFEDPFWNFFRRGQPDPNDDSGRTPRRSAPRGRLQPTGLGSGVIVSRDGYVLTNNHVIEGAEKVEVTLPDRRHFTAKVIGADAPSDIALLKIESRDLPTLPLGDSNQAEVGDVVLAVGNPLGVGQTVTMGIISAKGRSANTGSGSYEDFLQIDAAINRGNSGGALVNMRSELIGIPSQIVSQTGGNIGIGFAIPTSIAKNVMDQLRRDGQVHRGKLGLAVSPLTAEIANQFGYRSTQGALIQDVEPGSSAERTGIKPGDIVTEYQGQRIQDATQFRNLVAQTPPGTTVKLKVWRDNSERELTATLTEMTP